MSLPLISDSPSPLPPTPPSSFQSNSLPVDQLPVRYQQVFCRYFKHFNQIQSSLYQYLINDDKTLVICSPTGSGKTVLCELAIIRELMKLEKIDSSTEPNQSHPQSFKKLHVLYLAPLKAIVEEKCAEWKIKFAPFGLKCFALTGDTEQNEFNSAQELSYKHINILLATPEKFDFMIRNDHSSIRYLLSILQLVIIDEIHMLGDKTRGDVLEATITRVKALRQSIANNGNKHLTPLRFIAISATTPNVSDVATWLDHENSIGVKISAEMRPVRLEKIVLGFESNKLSFTSEYRFDIQLTYKLADIIRTHSESKPTLVFCGTRKSVEFTAKTLSNSPTTFFNSTEQHQKMHYELSMLRQHNFDPNKALTNDNEGNFKNIELRATMQSGVAFYHSGLDYSDRRLLERLFVQSLIPVMISTSSLAMGINLPAHLVVIKNTVQYINGTTAEYEMAQVLQMMGRAGRPQFDNSAKVIIMTRKEKKVYYESALIEQKDVESCLGRTFAEHLLVEIVLRTITNFPMAINWICSTFMYIRVLTNPSHYGSDIQPNNYESANRCINLWAQQTVARLERLSLITTKANDRSSLEPTQLARIVTRYAISLNTTEQLIKLLKESFDLEKLLTKFCMFYEMCQNVILRVTEKRFLNELNKNIRYKFKDRIKDHTMKVNCIIQSLLGCLEVETCLLNDGHRILRQGQGVSRCLLEMFLYVFNLGQNEELWFKLNINKLDIHFGTVLATAQLQKAFRAKLWHDSPFMSKQLPKIGNVMCRQLAERGYVTLEALTNAHPRDIEFCLKRQPPFGTFLIQGIKSLPKYLLKFKTTENSVSQRVSCLVPNESFLSAVQIEVALSIISNNITTTATTTTTATSANSSLNQANCLLPPRSHYFLLMVGCKQCDQLIVMKRLSDESLLSGGTFVSHIIVLQSTFQLYVAERTTLDAITTEITESDSKKRKNKKNCNNKNSAKKMKTFESRESPKHVHTGEMKDFFRKLNSSTNCCKLVDKQDPIKSISFHCCYIQQVSHTIVAHVISEQFVGLDVMAEQTVNFMINSHKS